MNHTYNPTRKEYLSDQDDQTDTETQNTDPEKTYQNYARLTKTRKDLSTDEDSFFGQEDERELEQVASRFSTVDGVSLADGQAGEDSEEIADAAKKLTVGLLSDPKLAEMVKSSSRKRKRSETKPNTVTKKPKKTITKKTPKIEKPTKITKHNLTIAELILLAIQTQQKISKKRKNNFSTFTKIRKLFSAANIVQVESITIKKVLKKLKRLKVIKYLTKYRFVWSGRKLPKSLVGSRSRSSSNDDRDLIQDERKKAKQIFKKLSKKFQRKGKTIDSLVYKHLSSGSDKSFRKIKKFLFEKHEILVSDFVLGKILERLGERSILDSSRK